MIALQAHIGSTAITHFKSGLVNFCLINKELKKRWLVRNHSCLSQSASMVGFKFRSFINKNLRSLEFCLTLFQDKVRKKNALRQIETSCHCSTQPSSNVYYTLALFRLRKSNEEKYGIKTKWNVNIPTTNIENNYKTFYTLQRAYLQNQDLTLLENIQLLLLAYQCPFTDGQVVYNARALYNLVNQTIVVYNDFNCANRGFSFRANNDSAVNQLSNDEELLLNQLITNEKETKLKFKQINNYIIYPNPAIIEVNILRNNSSNETLQISILDINGKVLLNKTIINQNNITKLNLNLIEGVYVVNITNSNGEKTTNKLVIVK